MLNRVREADPAGTFRWISSLLRLSVCLLPIAAAGCGGSGVVTVSKVSRARIVSDADADGNVTITKSRNPRRPAAGLRTARSIMDKNKKVD